LIAIADTDIGTDIAIDALTDTGGHITSDVLRAGFAAVNIRALLDAPVHHSERLVGLLSLDASTPYQWSDHERTTLREAADFLCVALRDADARRRLEDSELKFRLVAESSHAMIAWLQKDGAVYLNPELMRLTGYSHDELMQTSLWDLLHPDDRDMIRSYRGRCLRDQTAPSSYETRILTKSGETRWLDIRASTFELGRKQAILVTGLDITERKLSEQDLLKSEARLRTLMDHLGDGVGLMIDGRIVYANPAMG
jgi:PAS domain S-box-containing protein